MNNSTSISRGAEDFSDWISQAEAARIRGCKQQAIFNLVARGKLPTLKIGGKILVRRSDVEAYVPDLGGRPRKKAAAKKQAARKKRVD